MHTPFPSTLASSPLRRWVLPFCLAFLGAYILLAHLDYLNQLNPGNWGRRYLMVNRDNTPFVQSLRRAKSVVCVVWMAALAAGLFWSHRQLRHKGLTPDRQVEKRLLLGLFLFVFTVVNYDPPDIDLSMYFFFNSLGFAALAVALYHLPGGVKLFTKVGRVFFVLRLVPGWALALMMFLGIVFTAWRLGMVFFNHFPLTVDSSAQLVHAKILLFGRWWLPSHPLAQFFNMKLMVNDGRWYSQYPPGHVMLLAAGTYMKARAAVNPLLGGFTALVIWRVAHELYGARVGRFALLLCSLCAYLIMMSSEYMNHSTALFFASVFIWAYFRVIKRPHWLTGLVGGAAIGYCFITRPYTAIALAFPFMLHAAYLLLSQRARYRGALIAMGAAGFAFVLFQLYYNAATTGNMLTFGYEKSWGSWHNPFTETAKSKLSDGELLKNFRENMQRTGWLNRLTFEWPIPSLILLALAFGWHCKRREEKLLFLSILSMFVSCQVLPGNVDHQYGPRLVFETLCAILVLSAKTLASLPAALRRTSRARRPLSYYYGLALAFCACMYLFGYSHNLKVSTMANIYNFYYRGNDPGFYKFILRRVQQPALVLVTGTAYEAVSFANPPLSNSPVVFAADMGHDNKKIVRFYPHRKPYHAWIANGYHIEPLPRP